jgi:hypothetical protein
VAGRPPWAQPVDVPGGPRRRGRLPAWGLTGRDGAALAVPGSHQGRPSPRAAAWPASRLRRRLADTALIQPSGVQPSGVRPSGSLVRTRLSGRLVSTTRPVSSRVVCARPAGHSHLVPRPPGAGDRRPRDGGAAGHDWIESSSMWSGPSLAARSTAPRRHGCGHRCGGRVQAGGGAAAADWAGWCFGGRLHPTDQEGQTATRAPVAGDCARARGWLARCCAWHRAGRPAGLEPRPLCVVIAEPDGRVDEPGRRIRARRRGRRAAPARPSQVASATGPIPATL